MDGTGHARVVATVAGQVTEDRLGMVLVHEHLVVDYAETAGDEPVPVDVAERERLAAELRAAADAGVGTIVDCTPPHYGRDLAMIAEISAGTGVHVVASTGSFCEAWAPLPAAVASRTVDELTDTFVDELVAGASGGIRPGVIKAATSTPMTPAEQRILRAAARAQRACDVAIVSHTTRGLGPEQLDVYEREGAALDRVLVSHVGFEPDPLTYAMAIASRGAYVGFDKIGRHVFFPDSHWVSLIAGMREAGLLDRVLLSHDAVMRFSGPEHVAANVFSDLTYLSRVFLPTLADTGFDDSQIELLTRRNPARWLAGTGARASES